MDKKGCGRRTKRMPINLSIQFIKKIFVSIFGLTIIVYLLLAAAWFYILDHKETLSFARGSTLSRIMPSFKYLVDYANGEVPFDREQWESYKFYFEKASNMMPLRADVYGLLGYTYANLGEFHRAEAAFIKGVKLLPYYFWYRFNLGVAYYQQGQYAEAAESFNNALGLKLEETVNYIYKARMYVPLLIELPLHQKRIILGTGQAFEDVYLLMILCYLKSQDNDHLFKLAAYAINQQPAHPEIFYYYAGFAKFQLKDYPQALIYFDECIKRNPNFSEGYYYLGLTAKETGKEQLARVFLQQSVDIYQKHGPTLGNIEEKMKFRLFW